LQKGKKKKKPEPGEKNTALGGGKGIGKKNATSNSCLEKSGHKTKSVTMPRKKGWVD